MTKRSLPGASIKTRVKPFQLGNMVLNRPQCAGFTCAYEGCNSMRSCGTGHFGVGFSGRANSAGLCIL